MWPALLLPRPRGCHIAGPSGEERRARLCDAHRGTHGGAGSRAALWRSHHRHRHVIQSSGGQSGADPPATPLAQLRLCSARQEDLLSSSLPCAGASRLLCSPHGCWESSCRWGWPRSLARGAGVAWAGGLLGRKLS